MGNKRKSPCFVNAPYSSALLAIFPCGVSLSSDPCVLVGGGAFSGQTWLGAIHSSKTGLRFSASLFEAAWQVRDYLRLRQRTAVKRLYVQSLYCIGQC